MKVHGILAQKGDRVATITADTTIAQALDLMSSEGVGALVVSPDGKQVAGILSERDVVRGIADQGISVLERKAEDIMTRKVKSCAPEDDTGDLMRVMTDMRIRHLPVVKDGALCGIISIGDVVKTRVAELEDEASALREYIHG